MKLSSRISAIKPSPTLAITAKAMHCGQRGRKHNRFWRREPDFDTPLHIKMAAIKAIEEGFTKYTPRRWDCRTERCDHSEIVRRTINYITRDHRLLCHAGQSIPSITLPRFFLRKATRL